MRYTVICEGKAIGTIDSTFVDQDNDALLLIDQWTVRVRVKDFDAVWQSIELTDKGNAHIVQLLGKNVRKCCGSWPTIIDHDDFTTLMCPTCGHQNSDTEGGILAFERWQKAELDSPIDTLEVYPANSIEALLRFQS